MSYEQSVISFLDILGFRKLVETAEPELIERVLSKLRKHATPDNTSSEMFEMQTIAFSDSIVRSTRIRSKENLKHPSGILWHELFDIGFDQGTMIYEDGIFLRGGISAGDVYFKDGIMFGPGFLKAYYLEHKHACFPRILVDEHLVKLFKDDHPLLGAHNHDLKTDMNYIDELLDTDTDGYRFINYLEIARLAEDDDIDFLDMLDMHFKRVKEKAQENLGDAKVMPKYMWAAAYHNRVVERYEDKFFENYESTKAAFILTEKDVPGLDNWVPPQSKE